MLDCPRPLYSRRYSRIGLFIIRTFVMGDADFTSGEVQRAAVKTRCFPLMSKNRISLNWKGIGINRTTVHIARGITCGQMVENSRPKPCAGADQTSPSQIVVSMKGTGHLTICVDEIQQRSANTVNGRCLYRLPVHRCILRPRSTATFKAHVARSHDTPAHGGGTGAMFFYKLGACRSSLRSAIV